MAEPATENARLAEQYLLSVINDPRADPAQRIKTATTLAQLAHRYTPGAKGNAAADFGAKLPAANGDAAARRKAREDEIIRLATEIARTTGSQQVLELILLTLEATGDALADHRAALGALQRENAELKQRLDALEARGYTGVWDPQRSYTLGQYVTYGGSQWHADCANTGARPGAANGVWTLAIKRGRDGKDR